MQGAQDMVLQAVQTATAERCFEGTVYHNMVQVRDGPQPLVPPHVICSAHVSSCALHDACHTPHTALLCVNACGRVWWRGKSWRRCFYNWTPSSSCCSRGGRAAHLRTPGSPHHHPACQAEPWPPQQPGAMAMRLAAAGMVWGAVHQRKCSRPRSQQPASSHQPRSSRTQTWRTPLADLGCSSRDGDHGPW
jgi:hypothetical protein